MNKSNNPKVSIVSISYNQEGYIRQTLESMLMQKADFNFEIIIADDCSTDKTPEIIKEYSEKNPEIFSTILRKKNIGPIPNLFDAIKKAKGQYIAICEGDDYWTDENKLQLQADFLDENLEYALCFHPVRVFFEKGENDEFIYPETKDNSKFTTKELLRWNFIQTNSVMYRKQEYSDIATNIMPGDWYLHLYHAQFGKIGFIDEVMSAYRRHPGGIWWDSYNDKHKFWEKHGISHLAFYIELLRIYGGNSSFENTIHLHIQETINALIETDRKYGKGLLNKALSEFEGKLDTIIIGQNSLLQEQETLLKKQQDVISQLNGNTLKKEKLRAVNLEQELRRSQSELAAMNCELSHVYSSKGWRVTMLLRQLLSPIKKRIPKPVKKSVSKTTVLFKRAITKVPIVKDIKQSAQAELNKRRVRVYREKEYQRWVSTNMPISKDIELQRKEAEFLSRQPLISVVMPTYNTDPDFLAACIESVQDQSYPNWQLCIADDTSTNEETRQIIKKYADEDSRIQYVFRKNNGHICKASNSALKLAKGGFVALLDHDDVLWPNALFEVAKLLNEKPEAEFIYTDEDKVNEEGTHHSEPFFKPDWSPDYLRAVNYITHFAVIKRELIEKVGGFRPGYEGTQDWDLFLRVSRATDKIYHIPKVLYSWRISSTSTAGHSSAKEYAYENQKKALADDAEQRGYGADIKWEIPYLMWRVQYEITGEPLVSIVIPTKDCYDHMKTCLKSLKKSTYGNIEIIVVDTGSKDKRVWNLYEQYKKGKHPIRLLEWKGRFNFASVCNFGAEEAKGDYFLFLNNDTEVITPDWIEGLLEHAQRPETGAVGCKLLYPDKKLQHAGVILGVGGNSTTPGIAGHFFPRFNDSPPEDPAQEVLIGGVRNFMAVTAACVMVDRGKFEDVSGFNPEFEIAFNDVDFCLRLHDKGWNNVYTPHVKLYHHESVSVGKPGAVQRDSKVFDKEIALMGEKWGWELINNDPFYHPEFRRDVASARLYIGK